CSAWDNSLSRHLF
nr:immunoglobulin light chain junction region [Macaca mulatta]MPO03932.1 immunoglobulin light chain junction region [Macaca mulatta]MPO04312.1 immunoglobulin light chain junction region [Macaca mulatta]MPO07219.1 immunoglobulin light chain junction region [Macaca mulatta]MPO07664.1 immunoglobulin light chain junction region [Macaca mulatta]